MKVILIQDVKGRGKKDDIIEVADGFGMHLIRNRQAVEASKGGVKVLDKQLAEKKKAAENEREEALKVKEILEKKPLNFQLSVGKDGKVFKSISNKQIVDRIQSEYDIRIDKKKFKSKDNINTLGVTNIDIELYKGVVATIKVAIKEQ